MVRHKQGEEPARRKLAKLRGRRSENRKQLQRSHGPALPAPKRTDTTDGIDFLAQHASDLVFRLGMNQEIRFLSNSCQEILGIDPTDMLGRPWTQLLADSSHKQAHVLFDNACHNGEHSSQLTWLREAGTLDTEVHCYPIAHGSTSQPEVLGIARPLGGTPVQGEAAFGSAAWMASLAHELKQPLAAIANYTHACARLVRGGKLDSSELLEALDQAAHQAERAGEIIKRMRRLASPGELQRSTVQINDLVADALKLLGDDIRAGHVRAELHLGTDLPLVQADRIQLGQVLGNLIRNAIESMSRTPPAQRVLALSTLAAGKEVEVAIRDNGEGISAPQIQRLFEPFRSTKPHGMGLGLALSRAIVQAHGGRLVAKANADQGSTFLFTIPTTTQ